MSWDWVPPLVVLAVAIALCVANGLSIRRLHLKERSLEHRHIRYPVKASPVPVPPTLAAMGVRQSKTAILFRCETCTEPDAYVSITLDGAYKLDDLRLLPDDQYIQPDQEGEHDGTEVPAG